MTKPAYYAATGGGWRDWWTILHPPYTAWHLAYVVLGACLAPRVDAVRLGATLLAFFFATGVGAHALDELRGRPLRTRLGDATLVAAACIGLGGAVALGVAGVHRVGPWLVAFIAVGAVLVPGYNLELFGGRLHTAAGFAAAWGAFPVLTAYFAQDGRLGVPAVLGAGGAFFLSLAQRALSTPARLVRRKVRRAEARLEFEDGRVVEHDVLAPLEAALRAMSWGIVALAAALAVARLA